MPVTIACPKCQKKFQLPDAMRGKKVKCSQCGTAFRTAPAAAKPPMAAVASGDLPRLSDAELSQYGILGNLQRPPEIFTDGPPPPQAVAGLGNFAGEDPGFGGDDFVLPAEAAAAEADSVANPYAAVLNNPALRPVGKKKKSKKAIKAPIDYESYKIAVYGMSAIFWAGVYVLLCSVFLAILGLIIQVAPELLRNMLSNESVRNVVLFLFQLVFGWGLMACLMGVFVGQILCIFAPKPNERLNAGLAIGVVVLAVGLMMASILFFGLLGFATGADSQEGDAASAAIGLGMIGALVFCWLLALSSFFFFVNFYRKVGQNIESKDVVGAAQIALITWFVAVGVGVVIGITNAILASVLDDPESILQASQLSALLNFIMSVVMMGTWLNMVRTTINKLTPQ